MNISQLGVLQEIDLREAWVHEAHSFTPWLAEHLDQLAEVVGIQLELEGREVAVETFSADILARNPLDDSLVLIENQLEQADHLHLGQIMTYLAGLEARTIIWIARDFRDPHLSAFRWLNDHTTEQFAFFAVRVKVVRIGDSVPAPIFEVLVKPNQWERRLHALAQESQSLTSKGQFRLTFWEHYLLRHPDELRYGQASARSNRWRSIDGVDFVISTYLAKGSVGLFIRGPRGAESQEVYEALLPYAELLNQLTGAPLGEPEAGHYFVDWQWADTSQRDRWDELTDWLYEKTKQYERALEAIGE